MLSKVKIKEIRALEIKKFRDEQGLFVAEGNKLVSHLLKSFICERLVALPKWLSTHDGLRIKDVIEADENELKKISFLKTPQDVLAVFQKPCYALEDTHPESQLILALDNIQDPGNLGTIIRLSCWFGIEHIVCSPDTTDAFSPKVVQASMGALAHVNIHYANLMAYLSKYALHPIYGTFIHGENIYQSPLSQQGIIVMGNEGSGISPEIEVLVNRRLHIPSYPTDRLTIGSLNVATATAIVCSEFRRFCISSIGYHSGKSDDT